MSSYELTETQAQLREVARKFGQDYLAPAAMKTETAGEVMPREVLREMHKRGFMGLDIPAEYGGAGLDALTSAVVAEQLAGAWFSASSHAVALAPGPIIAAGTDAQRQKYLPGMASGELISAFALTEPQGGTDAASITTYARRDGNEYVINGTKIFITNGSRADVTVLFAKTDRNAPRGQGVSIFVVDKGAPGLRIGEVYRALAHEANPIAEMIFEDCRIPAENLIGEEGKGFAYIQTGFATRVRAIYGARCAGVAQAALDYAAQYAQDRQQFGQSIAHFQGLRFKMADMATKIEAARQLSYRAAVLAERDTADAAAAASMAKHFGSTVAMEVTSDAMQIMGGHGLIRAHPLERYYREAKLFQVGDGTSEVLRLIISRYVNRQAASGQSTALHSY